MLVTVSDKKIPVASTSNPNVIDYYNADVMTANDMYSGGMQMPGRTYQATPPSKYRFSINGQEKESELNENITTAEFWEYDSRIVRRWNIDPLIKIDESPYLCFSGNPIFFSDPSGAESEDPKNAKVLPTVVLRSTIPKKRYAAIRGRMKSDNLSWSEASTYFDKNGNEKKPSYTKITDHTKDNTGVNDIRRISSDIRYKALKGFAYTYGAGAVALTAGTAAPAFGAGMSTSTVLSVTNNVAVNTAAHVYRLYWMYGPSSAYVTNNYIVPFLDEGGGNGGLASMEGKAFDVASGYIKRLASQSAKGFDLFQCDKAVNSIVSNLTREGFGGEIISLQAKTEAGLISNTNLWSNTINSVISNNGFHTGVLVDGKVFDNIHVNGIDYKNWVKDFESIITTKITETRKRF